MKKAILLVLGCALISASCKKETGAAGLPAATQKGANTFGCLINGKLFVPKGNFSGTSSRQASYDVMARFFNVWAIDQSKAGKHNSVSITSESIELSTGVLVPLVKRDNGQASGRYWTGDVPNLKEFDTNSTNKGELKITFFNASTRIVAGTFWFDAVDGNGEKVEVREGRFDMKF